MAQLGLNFRLGIILICDKRDLIAGVCRPVYIQQLEYLCLQQVRKGPKPCTERFSGDEICTWTGPGQRLALIDAPFSRIACNVSKKRQLSAPPQTKLTKKLLFTNSRHELDRRTRVLIVSHKSFSKSHAKTRLQCLSHRCR